MYFACATESECVVAYQSMKVCFEEPDPADLICLDRDCPARQFATMSELMWHVERRCQPRTENINTTFCNTAPLGFYLLPTVVSMLKTTAVSVRDNNLARGDVLDPKAIPYFLGSKHRFGQGRTEIAKEGQLLKSGFRGTKKRRDLFEFYGSKLVHLGTEANTREQSFASLPTCLLTSFFLPVKCWPKDWRRRVNKALKRQRGE